MVLLWFHFLWLNRVYAVDTVDYLPHLTTTYSSYYIVVSIFGNSTLPKPSEDEEKNAEILEKMKEVCKETKSDDIVSQLSAKAADPVSGLGLFEIPILCFCFKGKLSIFWEVLLVSVLFRRSRKGQTRAGPGQVRDPFVAQFLCGGLSLFTVSEMHPASSSRLNAQQNDGRNHWNLPSCHAVCRPRTYTDLITCQFAANDILGGLVECADAAKTKNAALFAARWGGWGLLLWRSWVVSVTPSCSTAEEYHSVDIGLAKKWCFCSNMWVSDSNQNPEHTS